MPKNAHNTTRAMNNSKCNHGGRLDAMVEPMEGRGGKDVPLALAWIADKEERQEQHALQTDR